MIGFEIWLGGIMNLVVVEDTIYLRLTLYPSHCLYTFMSNHWRKANKGPKAVHKPREKNFTPCHLFPQVSSLLLLCYFMCKLLLYTVTLQKKESPSLPLSPSIFCLNNHSSIITGPYVNTPATHEWASDSRRIWPTWNSRTFSSTWCYIMRVIPYFYIDLSKSYLPPFFTTSGFIW